MDKNPGKKSWEKIEGGGKEKSKGPINAVAAIAAAAGIERRIRIGLTDPDFLQFSQDLSFVGKNLPACLPAPASASASICYRDYQVKRDVKVRELQGTTDW